MDIVAQGPTRTSKTAVLSNLPAAEGPSDLVHACQQLELLPKTWNGRGRMVGSEALLGLLRFNIDAVQVPNQVTAAMEIGNARVSLKDW
jgi:hypothetical protein